VSRPARLLDLVHLLAGRRSRTVAELAQRFDVSERTVFRDLAELSERHIPLTSDEHGYRLLDTATLRPLNFTTEEHALLKVALHNPALRHQPSLRATLDALEAKLDAASALAEETPQALQLAGVDRSGPKSEKAIQPLERSIERRRAVDIRYDSLSGGKHQWRGLEPWQLF
jgi:predicted DNA-binding transcriptional regulator YafY